MDSLLAVFAKLAPLSIVIAAIGLVHSLQQTKKKRDADEATQARQTLNTLGTRAYLLNWSLLGSSAMKVVVKWGRSSATVCSSNP